MNTQTSPIKPRRISASLFGAILIFFMLPFVTASCNNGTYTATLNGYQLATGTDIEGEPVPPTPVAIVALASAVFGLGLSFLKVRHIAIASTLLGMVGLISLLWLAADINAYMHPLVTMRSRFGLSFTQLLFAAAAGVNAFIVFTEWKGKTPNTSAAVPMPTFSELRSPQPPPAAQGNAQSPRWQAQGSPGQAAGTGNASKPVPPPPAQQSAPSWPEPSASGSGSASPPRTASPDAPQPSSSGYVWKQLDDED